MNEADPFARIIRWSLAIVGLALLALVTLPSNSATRMFMWPWWPAYRALWIIPGLIFFYTTLRVSGSLGISGRKLWTFLLIGFGAVQLVSALSSPSVAESLSASLIAISFCFLIAVLVPRPNSRDQDEIRIASLLARAGVVFCVFSFWLWLTEQAIPAVSRIAELNEEVGSRMFHLNSDGFRNDRPLGHSNYTAGVALLVLPWSIYFVRRRKGTVRLFWAVAAVAIFALLISSGSRGAILGMAAGVGFGAMLFGVHARWSIRRYLMAATAALFVFAILVAAVPRVRESLVRYVSEDSAVNDGDRQRIAMMEIGTAMGADRWWIGQGPGLTSWLYPKYRHTVDGGVDASFQLHSTPIQIWAENGLPGLIFWFGLLGLALATAFNHARQTKGERPADMVFFAGVTVAAYGAFSLTDYQLDLPVVAAGLAANIAILAGTSNKAPGSFPHPRRFYRVIPAVFAVGFCILWVTATIPEWRARRLFAGAMTNLEQGGATDEFNRGVVEAVASQPTNPHYFAGAGAAHLRFAWKSDDSETRIRHLASARAFFEQALKIESDLEIAHYNLGWLVLPNSPLLAAGHFRRTIWLLPDRAGAYLGLGIAHLEAGDEAKAIEALALEIANDPAILTSPMWDTPLLNPYADEVANRAIEITGKWSADNHEIRYLHLLLRWLQGDDSVVSELSEAKDETRAQFFSDLGHQEPFNWNGNVTLSTPGWMVLRAAAEHPEDRAALLRQFVFSKTERNPTDLELEILQRVLDREGFDSRGWLRASEGREPPFVHHYRRNRRSYPIVARNVDIPVSFDAYLAQENLLTTWFFSFLFPPHGNLPDSLLLSYAQSRSL